MKWITRERVKVDRVACPWLIRKFVDKEAEFYFVPSDKVMKEAERLGAIPFDFPGVELGHRGKECSFDAVIRKYNLSGDPALVLSLKSSMGRIRTTLFTTSRRVRGLRRLQRDFVIWDSGMTTKSMLQNGSSMTRFMHTARKE